MCVAYCCVDQFKIYHLQELGIMLTKPLAYCAFASFEERSVIEITMGLLSPSLFVSNKSW